MYAFRAGGSTVSQWTLTSMGNWESSSITSGSTSGTDYTQYVKIHALVRKTAESEESSVNPFVGGLGLQPIIRDARIGLELVDPNSHAAPARDDLREQPQV